MISLRLPCDSLDYKFESLIDLHKNKNSKMILKKSRTDLVLVGVNWSVAYRSSETCHSPWLNTEWNKVRIQDQSIFRSQLTNSSFFIILHTPTEIKNKTLIQSSSKNKCNSLVILYCSVSCKHKKTKNKKTTWHSSLTGFRYTGSTQKPKLWNNGKH